MMFFRSISVLTFLFLSLNATSTLAEPTLNFSSSSPLISQFPGNGPGFGRGRQGRRGQIMEALDLSQEQKNELQSIRNQYQPRIQDKQKTLFEARQSLREMMIDDTASSEVRRQHQQVQTLRQDMSDLRFESMLKMRNVLTPDQREEFAELMQERRRDRGFRRRGRGFDN